MFFFFSSRRRHTRCALVTGVQTCALPISPPPAHPRGIRPPPGTWRFAQALAARGLHPHITESAPRGGALLDIVDTNDATRRDRRGVTRAPPTPPHCHCRAPTGPPRGKRPGRYPGSPGLRPGLTGPETE